MPFGEPRKLILRQALQELAGEESVRDDVEAHAVALAMLAQQDAEYLTEASSALNHATKKGMQLNWALLHMAEAWLAAGNFPEALRCASSVQPDYFDDQDLHWRSVRMNEIHAVALLELGRFSSGVEVAMNLCAELVRSGDTDDLASPVQLAQAAFSLVATNSSADAVQAGCVVLRTISHSIDVTSWFPPELVDEFRVHLATCAERVES